MLGRIVSQLKFSRFLPAYPFLDKAKCLAHAVLCHLLPRLPQLAELNQQDAEDLRQQHIVLDEVLGLSLQLFSLQFYILDQKLDHLPEWFEKYLTLGEGGSYSKSMKGSDSSSLRQD